MTDIQAFCGFRDTRKWLNEPFVVNDILCATDGAICVITYPRADGQYSVAPKLADEQWTRLNKVIAEIEQQPADTFRRASLKPSLRGGRKCPQCNETGIINIESCPDCSGRGVIEFIKGRHNYYPECQECHATGERIIPGSERVCPSCHGTGEYFDRHKTIKWRDVRLAKHYLSLLRTLPNLRIAPAEDRLYFSGGDFLGVLMGCAE